MSPALNVVVLGLSFGVMVHLIVTVIRGRARDTRERRLMEFGLATTVMLLVSPFTPHAATVVTLPALVGLFALWRQEWPRRWPKTWVALAAAGAGLIGVFLPLTTLRPLLSRLLSLTGNVPFWEPNIGAYQLLALPGLGLIALWSVFALLALADRDAAHALPRAAV
jgi:hypothetical protein